MGSADSHDTQIAQYYPISSIDGISAVVADRNGAKMRTPTSIGARTALRWGRDRTRRLMGRRRPQLLFAVLLGTIIGGGFTAVASVGLGDHEHEGGAAVSVSGQAGDQSGDSNDYSGYDHHNR